MKNLFLLASSVLALVALAACSSKMTNTSVAYSKINPLDARVDSILNLMTLEEKVGQLNQYNGFWEITGPSPKEGQAAKKYDDLKKGLVGSMLNVKGVKDVRALQKIAVEETRLGIPLIFGFDVIHGYKTISPIPLAESASWDMEAIKRSAAMAAEEASAVGLNWTFAPMVDVARDARWGRVMEGAGEDAFLGSKIAVARVQGFQGTDLAATNTILACAKHFAGYGFAESGRDYNTVDVSETTLQNTIFPPFKAAVDAGVRTFMNSFNELNGIPATGNRYLQRQILKGDWSFDGFVVSDWGSINEMVAHGYAKDSRHAAEIAIKAGSDMDMESNAYVGHLVELVQEGKVSENLIDDAARRILKVKFELGLFDNPYKYCDETREKETVGSAKFQEEVLDMAKKSIVLLKNEKELLPLKKSGLKIALIGALANDKTSPLGSWRIAADDESAVSVLEGLQKYEGNKLNYVKGADVSVGRTQFVWETNINMTDKSGFPEAIDAAKQADVVIMVLGEHGLQSGEGRSRSDLGLPGVQQELLETIFKANPNVVGDYNPSGKLPMTFPRNVGQVPIYYNYKNTGRPIMNEPESVFWSHYIDVENTPLYPFGYGLSYSKFEYSDLKLSDASFSKNGKIVVSVKVKNTGKVTGKEVVQLYIRDLIGSVTRPVKELKGFEMIELKANETKEITFSIDNKTIEFYTANNKWEAEPGDFNVFVGGSSAKTLQMDFQYSN